MDFKENYYFEKYEQLAVLAGHAKVQDYFVKKYRY